MRDSEGRVGADAVAAAVTKGPILVTVMHSNNEVGAVQPSPRSPPPPRRSPPAAERAAVRRRGAVDWQAAIDVAAEGVAFTIVGHKFGAPKGVAASTCAAASRRGTRSCARRPGGGAARGTECVVLRVALGEAAEIATAEAAAAHMAMRSLLLELLTDGLGTEIVRVNGPADAARRLPNVGRPRRRAPSELLATLSESVAASAAPRTTPTTPPSPPCSAMEVPHAQAVHAPLDGAPHDEAEVRRAAALIIAEAKRQLKL